MLKKGDKVALVCNSDPRREEERSQILQLVEKLENIGIIPVHGDYLYESLSGQERAKILMDVYRHEEIKMIFDVSGGNQANGVLPHLAYEEIAKSPKIFCGYSDLTTVINAIYAKTGKASVLYQIRNILHMEHEDLFHIDYEMVQGQTLQGIVVGGNIRCFLKLAGTSYMPDLTGKILLLEARNGLTAQIDTCMAQLSQLGAFEKVSGVLLGTFTKLEAIKGMPRPEEILKQYVRDDLPVAVTRDIGHGMDAKAIWIGKELGKGN